MRNLLKQLVVGGAVVTTLVASATVAYAKEKGVSGITFSGGGPNGIGGKEEFSATGALQSDGTLAGDLTSSTSGKLTWKAVRTVAR